MFSLWILSLLVNNGNNTIGITFLKTILDKTMVVFLWVKPVYWVIRSEIYANGAFNLINEWYSLGNKTENTDNIEQETPLSGKITYLFNYHFKLNRSNIYMYWCKKL